MNTLYSRLKFISACLGNLFEHYDTALFGLLSSFLAPLIFPQHDPLTALIMTYAMIPLGMLARPIGSLLFGYVGDVYGREQALFLTLAGMALVSACFAFIPSYAEIGIWAPLAFCVGRALQNFFAAGETMGGALYVLENAPSKQRDFLSGLYNATTMGGHLLASFAIYFLSQNNLVEVGWRYLYLCGSMTALFGCLMRLASPMKERVSSSFRLSDLVSQKSLLCIVITSGFGAACFSVALVLMNGFIPLVTTVTKAEMMRVNSYLLLFDCLALPFFGWIASKITREKLMLAASLGVAILSTPLFLFLEKSSLPGVIVVRTVFVIFGVAFFAPFHAWAQELVPSSHRYALLSFGYALGSQLLGSPTAAFALWCFQKTGMIISVAWYWIFLSLAATVVLAWTSQSKNRVLMSKE